MPDSDKNWLVVRSDSLLSKTGPGRILAGMVEEMLALGKEGAVLQTAEFKICDYTWCEPDYRQILLWAEALKIEPATVIKKLIAGENSQDVATRFQNGRLLSLSWNLDELPLSDFRCVEGLTIEKLRLYSPEHRTRAEGREVLLRLPSLRFLECVRCQIGVLTLSGVPNLTVLRCCVNQLTELGLYHVANLTKLDCSGNPLRKLELSHVPNLTNLSCWGNLLTELDLSGVPKLTTLVSMLNLFTYLDLSNVTNLTYLQCFNSLITELDIRPLLSLRRLLYDVGSTRLIRRPDQNF